MAEEEKKGKSKATKLKVLVPIDGSDAGYMAVKRVGQYSKLANVDITLLTVLEDVVSYRTIPDTPIYRERIKNAEEVLEKAKKNLVDHGVNCNTKIAVGPVAAEIVRIGEEGQYTSIFMGSRGLRGLKRMLLGSVADDVIRHAHCSVTIIR